VQGVGIAAPLSLGGWQSLLGLPPEVAAKWQHLDLAQAVGRLTDLPVTLIKDTAAACVAELVAGRGRSVKSFLYVFVDTFIGGGLVLDSHLRAGITATPAPWARCRSGLAGALPCNGSQRTGATAQRGLAADAGARLRQRRPGRRGRGRRRALQAPWRPHPGLAGRGGRAASRRRQGAACLLDLEA
jgi:hypothetical protein